ncbi:hypothetical protein D3C87_2076760 [compost metagenome]
MQRVVVGAHQHQNADPVPALQPTALHQLIDCTTQGMAIDLIAFRQLLLGRQVVATAVLGAQLLFQLRGDLLVAGGKTGRMSR